MGKFFSVKKLHIWIACLAILMNALVPSISQAMMAGGGQSNLIELCTVNGTQYISLDQAGPDKSSGDSTQHHVEHCPYCMTHAGTFALPFSASPLLLPISGHDVFPPLFYHSATPLFSWTPSSPRGPPSLS